MGRTLAGSVYMPLGIRNHCAVIQAALPQLVTDLQVLLGDVVPAVVSLLRAHSEVENATVEVGGDDVPGDPPTGEMVERRHAPGEGIGVLERHGCGDSEPEIFGRGRHRGNQLQRIVHRKLDAAPDRRIAAVAVDIVDSEHIGEEHRVDLAALEGLGHLDPVVDVEVAPARARPPQWPGRGCRTAVARRG